jgi:hypothetical protein
VYSNIGGDVKYSTLFAILLAVAGAAQAEVSGNLAEVAIIDRDSGVALHPYYYRGEYWVAGRPGARYALQIRNRLGERLLAVTSVDGVNVLSGATASWDQTGYVFSPGECYQVTGWRKSDTQVAAFTFTESSNSYAARTGRPGNVGVIGVAVFRERQPEPTYEPQVAAESPAMPERREAESGAADASQDKVAPSASRSGDTSATARARQAPKLGTGHGDREYSYVDHTDFARLQSYPNEVIRIHYDSYRNLVAMGVIKQPRPLQRPVNPFPASPDNGYVPDPPG